MQLLSFAGASLPVVSLPAKSQSPDGLSLAQNWCNACHVVVRGDTSFDDGEIAPPFSALKTLSLEKLTALLRKGHGQTPALSKLTNAEIAALSKYIASQSKN